MYNTSRVSAVHVSLCLIQPTYQTREFVFERYDKPPLRGSQIQSTGYPPYFKAGLN